MEMEHGEFLVVQAQLQDHFDGRYVRQTDCKLTVDKEEEKIDSLSIEIAKLNTTMKALIAVLSPIAVAVLGVAVKLLFS